MNKKEVVLIALISSVLISAFSLGISPEDNIIASISNPRMVLYHELGDNSLKFQNSVFVNNENEFDVKISIKPIGVWEKRIEVLDNNFVLSPDERREAFYDVTLNEVGEFGGDILVVFEREGNPNLLSISQRLVVHVTKENSGDKKTTSTEKILSVSAIIFVLAFLSALLFANKKRWKKEGENKKK